MTFLIFAPNVQEELLVQYPGLRLVPCVASRRFAGFDPSTKAFMINYRVGNLDVLVVKNSAKKA